MPPPIFSVEPNSILDVLRAGVGESPPAKDGTSFPAFMRNVAIKGIHGNPAGVVGFIVDLTTTIKAPGNSSA